MLIFTTVQQSDQLSMIIQSLLRRHSQKSSHSLITYMCENVNATSTLILSLCSPKADRTSSWIEKEWKSSWTMWRRSCHNFYSEHQIWSASSRVMLSGLWKTKREKASISISQSRHSMCCLTEDSLVDHIKMKQWLNHYNHWHQLILVYSHIECSWSWLITLMHSCKNQSWL